MSLTNINILIREWWASSSHMVHITLKKKMAVIKDHHQTIVQLLILSAISLHDSLSLTFTVCFSVVSSSCLVHLESWIRILCWLGFLYLTSAVTLAKVMNPMTIANYNLFAIHIKLKSVVIQGKIVSVQKVILPWDHNVLFFFFSLKCCFDPVWILRHFLNKRQTQIKHKCRA